MSTVYDDGDALYVAREGYGELLVVPADGKVTTSFQLPADAAELTHPDDAVADVLERISDVPMPRAVRAAIAERLGVDMLDVGQQAPSRKRKAS